MKEKNICSEHIPEVPKISFSSDISFPPPIAFSSPLDFGEQVSFIFRTDSEEITVDDVSKLQSFYSCSEGLNYLRGISRGLLQLSLSAYIAEETYIFRLENDWVIQGDTHPRSSQLQQVQAEHYLATSTICLEQCYLPTPSSPLQLLLSREALSSSGFHVWGN